MGVKRLNGGRWEASYRDPSGRERVKHCRTRAEADRWLATVKTDMARGDYVDPRLARARFGSWAEEWLATTTHLKPKTRANYEGALRCHVVPVFGEHPIASIQQVDVRRFVAELASAGAGPATIEVARKVLRLVLAAAQGSGGIKSNPCDGVKIPRARAAEMVFLDAEQVEVLASSIQPPFGTMIRFAAYTGLRAGEIGALRVSRLDLVRSRAEVAESVSEVAGRGLLYGPTKTYSRRTVRLPASVRDELAVHVAPRVSDPSAFVFTAPEGGPLRHGNFYRRLFKPAVVTAGLPSAMRFHDLRHTCASLLIALGAHPKAIQERLGHSSITVTLDRYGHLFPQLDEALTARLDDLRRSAVEAVASRSDGTVLSLER
jgi:integrase